MCAAPSMDAGGGISPALLLELAASDDLPAFRCAVEEHGLPFGQPSPWYGRWWSCKRPTGSMGFEDRTPLMVAALYGSSSVLAYILSADPTSEVNGAHGSDSATALHCAAAGGAAASLQAVKLLLDASADINALDASGNRPIDVVPKQKPTHKARSASSSLEMALRGVLVADKAQEEDEEDGLSLSLSSSLSSSPAKEKKEYPVDATLPDIKSGVYGTDEFRMYTFKVKPCSRAYSHDWTECPFVHPGENARRRDPRKYHYSCVPCPEFRKGSCRNGDSCEYAHGVFESWLHPAQYRTRLCKDEIGCNRRVCFFAHKPEELRPLYPSSGSPGSVVSSPRAMMNLPPLDLGAAAAAMLLGQNSPMSPSSTSALAAAASWLNQTGGVMTTPTAQQLQSSRLKAAVSARDLELDFELLGLERQRLQHQQLVDELNLSSPSWANNSLSAGMPRNSDYGDLFGSPDSTLVSPMRSLSLKQTAAAAAAAAQYQSPPGIQKHQNLTQQLHSGGYGSGNLPSSPISGRSPSTGFGHDYSLAASLMNSRASAFAKRSQSFIDRGAVSRNSGIFAPTNMPTPVGAMPGISDWGSPDGKLDWGIHGEELNKLRKSASFGFRSNGSHMGAAAAASMADEPDVSWVQSLVKDGPSPVGQQQQQQQQKKKQCNLNGGGSGEFLPGDMFSSSAWAEQLYMEQEQMVA